MGWDPDRPVPWRRMVNEWLIYVAIMLVIVVLFFRDLGLAGVVGGLLASGPLYLGFGYVLAKFGYRRASWSELREQRAQRGSGRGNTGTSGTSAGEAAGPRPKPPPTKRTGGGSSRPGGPRKRR